MNRPSARRCPLTNVSDLLVQASLQISESLRLDKHVARLEARVLAAFAWKVAPSWLIAHDTDRLSLKQISRFNSALQQRLEGYPIAYITGSREFYGRDFHVTADVLIPRPETELLVDLALARIPQHQTLEILELGTGSGCVAITLALERPGSLVTSVDNSHAALVIARLNQQKWNAELTLLESDWFSALGTRKFDLIVGNPPYIDDLDPHLKSGDVRYEPPSALQSGQNGMEALVHIIESAPAFLKVGGWLILEHGYDQSEYVQHAFSSRGFVEPQTRQDIAGHHRVTLSTGASG